MTIHGAICAPGWELHNVLGIVRSLWWPEGLLWGLNRRNHSVHRCWWNVIMCTGQRDYFKLHWSKLPPLISEETNYWAYSPPTCLILSLPAAINKRRSGCSHILTCILYVSCRDLSPCWTHIYIPWVALISTGLTISTDTPIYKLRKQLGTRSRIKPPSSHLQYSIAMVNKQART